MFVEDPEGQFSTLGQKTRAKKVTFNSIFEGRKFIRDCKDISGLNLFGLERFEYVYINDTYPTVNFDRSKLSISNIDIEVYSTDGFPHADVADKEITAITILNKGISYVFGCKSFDKENDPNIHYFKCKGEKDLLYRFLKIWITLDTDIVTGWNIGIFDIPYLINRITKLFDEDIAKLLSPWKLIDRHTYTSKFGKEVVEFTIVGVAVLDYLNLYKKFTYTQQANYRLGFIAQLELGEDKIDYSEYDSLAQLYEKDYQKFIVYNIRDVGLVDRLDQKLKLVDLAITIAFDSKINFQDVFTSVSPWDVIIHNYLLNTKKTVIPQRTHHLNVNSDRVPGAFVKDPLLGLKRWIVSIDVKSDYPFNMIQWNISPETFVKRLNNFPTIDQIVRDECVPKIDGDYTITGNGCLYKKDVIGVLGELLQKLSDDRDIYKKKMIEAKNADQKTPSQKLNNQISEYDNFQQAVKIKLNSLYGALANEGCRYYSTDNASAVTSNGVMIIKWSEKKINQRLNTILGTTNVDYVVAIDTDSLYFSLDDLVQRDCKNFHDNEICDFIDRLCATDLVLFINNALKDLAKLTNALYTDKIVMKREAIGSTGFWVAKRRYCLKILDNEGVRFKEPKIKIMGGEAIRSSTPAACRDSIKQAVYVILNKDNKALIEYINQFREQFMQLSFSDIAFPRGISDIDKYQDSTTIYKKGTPIHVKGALLYNHYIFEKQLDKIYPMIYNGDKLLFCYLKTPNPINNTVISVPHRLPPELNLDDYLDRQTQFEKAFLEPIKNMAETIGWDIEKRNIIAGFFRKKV